VIASWLVNRRSIDEMLVLMNGIVRWKRVR
jgi:hypothetical protein